MPYAGTFVAVLVRQMENATRFKPRAKDALSRFAAGAFTWVVVDANQAWKGLEEEQLGGLLAGLLSADPSVRLACLEALQNVPCIKRAAVSSSALNTARYLSQYHLVYRLTTSRFWHAMQDTEEDNKRVAVSIWDKCHLALPTDDSTWQVFFDALADSAEEVRTQAARAIAAALAQDKTAVGSVLQRLFSLHIRNVRR
jgi:hypothetical protein